MKLFTEATNLDLTDPTNYQNGQLKDATTTTAKDGTRINKTLLADIRTVFTRALKLSGIVPNGNFDTDNSSQLFDALKKSISTDGSWVSTGIAYVNGSAQDVSNLLKYNISDGGKKLNIKGTVILGGATWNGSNENFLQLTKDVSFVNGGIVLAVIHGLVTVFEFPVPPTCPITLQIENMGGDLIFSIDQPDIAYYLDKAGQPPYSALIDISIPLD